MMGRDEHPHPGIYRVPPPGLKFILLYCGAEKIDVLPTEGFSTVKKKKFYYSLSIRRLWGQKAFWPFPSSKKL